jgi:hypothetical protein
MMDDHVVICEARNELADALKVLLNPAIMGASDFLTARNHAQAAMNALNRLLEMTMLGTCRP